MYIPPHWGIFLALIVSFLVFWFIFDGLFFRPFLKVLSERERRLKELGERTAKLVEEGRTAEKRRSEELAAVRHGALLEREAERRRAEGEAAELIEKARSEAHAALERVREGIEREMAAAELKLEEFAQSLGADLAERVLRRRLADTQARLNN